MIMCRAPSVTDGRSAGDAGGILIPSKGVSPIRVAFRCEDELNTRHSDAECIASARRTNGILRSVCTALSARALLYRYGLTTEGKARELPACALLPGTTSARIWDL